jgi:hypothetical protein
MVVSLHQLTNRWAVDLKRTFKSLHCLGWKLSFVQQPSLVILVFYLLARVWFLLIRHFFKRNVSACYSAVLHQGKSGFQMSLGDRPSWPKYFVVSNDSSVDVVTRLQAGRSEFRIPAGATDYFLLQNVQTGCWAHTVSYSVGSGGLFSWD